MHGIPFLSYRLDRSLGVPYVGLATGLAAAVGVVIATTEYFVPWNTDVPVSAYLCSNAVH